MADTKMQTSPEIAIKAKTGNPSAKAGIKVKGTTLGELRQDLALHASGRG